MSKFNIEDAAYNLLCVETALNMPRMANIENLLTLEHQSNVQSLGQN